MSIASAGRQRSAMLAREQKWDRRFMRIAEEVASWSKDPSTKVGAVLVLDNIVVGTGYNGLPRGMLDENLEDRDSKLSRTIHAEMNAVLNTHRPDLEGATLYVTPLMVCDRCAVHLIQAGIARVVIVPQKHMSGTYGARELEWQRAGERALRYFAQASVEVCVLGEEE